MKKLFFSFTIATMMVSLMSCGNSGGKSTGDMESTAIENSPNNIIENDYLTAILPEGWEKANVYDKGFTVNTKDDKVAIEFKAFDANFDLQGWVEHRKMDGTITDKIDDVSIGGITFQQYAHKHPDMPYLYLVSYSNKGQYRFEVFNSESRNEPGVKQLLESVKFK